MRDSAVTSGNHSSTSGPSPLAFDTSFPSASLTTSVEASDGIQAYPGVYIGRPNGRWSWYNDQGKDSEETGGQGGSKPSSNKRGIGTTRSRRVINERDSQDFTVARVVFVKRHHYHYYQHQRYYRECRIPMNEWESPVCSDVVDVPARMGCRSMPRFGAALAICHCRYIVGSAR